MSEREQVERGAAIQTMLARNEATLIGTILGVTSRNELRGYGLVGQAAELRSVDFRDARHQQAFQAILDLVMRGSAPNGANVYAEVAVRTDEATASYIARLQTGAVDTDDVGEMVKLVRVGASLRRTYRFGQTTVDIVEAVLDGRKTLWDAEREFEEVVEAAQLAAPRRPIVVADNASLMADLLRRIEEQSVTGRRSLVGPSTGVGVLDDATGGWRPGSLHLIGSVTGVGKTTFAINAMLAAAQAGLRPLMVSLEMDSDAIARRAATIYTNSSYGALGRMSVALRETATVGFAELPFQLVAQTELSATDIAGAVWRARSQMGCDLLIVDHVQMVTWVGKDDRVPRWKQIDQSTWRLLELAQRLNIPLVMTAQLNPPPPMKGGERAEPSADDIRESKEPHNAAGLFVVVHQKRNAEGPTGETFLLVQKNRFGPVGRLEVSYTPATGRFADKNAPPPPRREPYVN